MNLKILYLIIVPLTKLMAELFFVNFLFLINSNIAHF